MNTNNYLVEREYLVLYVLDEALDTATTDKPSRLFLRATLARFGLSGAVFS